MKSEFIQINNGEGIVYIRQSDVLSVTLKANPGDQCVTLDDFVPVMSEAIERFKAGWRPKDEDPVYVEVCYREAAVMEDDTVQQTLMAVGQYGCDILPWVRLLGASAADMAVARKCMQMFDDISFGLDDEAVHGVVPPMAPGEEVL